MKTYFYSLLIGFLYCASNLSAQHLYVNPRYAIGIEELNYSDYLGPNQYRVLGDDLALDSVAYSSWIFQSYGANVGYDLNRYLGFSLDLSYSTGGYGPDQVDDQITEFKLSDLKFNPKLYFDALYKNEYEKLIAYLGANLGYRIHRENYWYDDPNASGSTSSLEYSMIRRGFTYGLLMGIEWQDYFSPKFGYNIGLEYAMSYRFRPSSISFDQYTINSEPTAAQGIEMDYPISNVNNGRNESFQQSGIYLRVGLLYRIL